MRKILSVGKILLGAVLFAAGFRLFLYPRGIVPGGVTGAAMAVSAVTGLPVGTLAMAVNLPIFLAGRLALGRRFLLGSLLGAAASSAAIDLLGLTGLAPEMEPLLAALYGGALSGAGLGIVFSAGYSTGGTDIIVLLLRRRWPHMDMGRLLLLVDLAVIAAGAAVTGRAGSALYAIPAVFVSSRVLDAVVYGGTRARVCCIVSARPEEIVRQISRRLGRGATILYGAGAYTGQKREIVVCVIRRRQVPGLRALVRETDGSSFVWIQEAWEVLGSGFAPPPRAGD